MPCTCSLDASNPCHQSNCGAIACSGVCEKPCACAVCARRRADLVDDDLGARVDEHVLERLAEVRQVLGVARHLALQKAQWRSNEGLGSRAKPSTISGMDRTSVGLPKRLQLSWFIRSKQSWARQSCEHAWAISSAVWASAQACMWAHHLRPGQHARPRRRGLGTST